MNSRLINISAALLCMLFMNSVVAARYTPQDADMVVATWPSISSEVLQKAQAEKHLHPNDPTAVVSLANNYLAQAGMPGQSRLYGLAQATLKPLILSNSQSPQVWLAWAQVLQHQHAFNEALDALDKVFAQDAHNTNANLLAARIHLIQAKPAQARQACLALLGYSDLLTTSTCVLEVTSYQPGKLHDSYQQLITFVKRDALPVDERGVWIAQVLADMALRLKNPKSAEDWLAPHLQNATVNYHAQWADTQFAQNKPQSVLDVLGPVVLAAAEMDDLLLLQLAIAEKQISKATKWQDLLAERVSLREQRQDAQHANELARYYLDISLQPKRALQWAELHWKNSREFSDQQLLQRAQAATQSSPRKEIN